MERFFNTIRPLFSGGLSQSQVDGINLILETIRAERLGRQPAAYVFATAFHETGQRMVPVREGFANTDAEALRTVTKLYKDGRISRNYATPDPQTGKSYYGRGLVQLTHKENYQRAGNLLGIDLLNDPNKALDPEISAKILVRGMREGWFTGVKLVDVSEPVTSEINFENDRRVVNGTDRAKQIAKYADVFYEALRDVDLLSESRTIAAANKQNNVSILLQIVLSVGAFLEAVNEFFGSPNSILDSLSMADKVGKYMPSISVVIMILAVVAFFWTRILSKRIEGYRREDHEKNGV